MTYDNYETDTAIPNRSYHMPKTLKTEILPFVGHMPCNHPLTTQTRTTEVCKRRVMYIGLECHGMD